MAAPLPAQKLTLSALEGGNMLRSTRLRPFLVPRTISGAPLPHFATTTPPLTVYPEAKAYFWRAASGWSTITFSKVAMVKQSGCLST